MPYRLYVQFVSINIILILNTKCMICSIYPQMDIKKILDQRSVLFSLASQLPNKTHPSSVQIYFRGCCAWYFCDCGAVLRVYLIVCKTVIL